MHGLAVAIAGIRVEDLDRIASAALSEARFTYAVPRYLDHQSCKALVGQMLVA